MKNHLLLTVSTILLLACSALPMTQRTARNIFKSGSWNEFYKRHPNSEGVIVLSRVGFNAGMNQALLYIDHTCGGLCGTGHYVLLEKSHGAWRVVKREMVWVS